MLPGEDWKGKTKAITLYNSRAVDYYFGVWVGGCEGHPSFRNGVRMAGRIAALLLSPGWVQSDAHLV